MGRGYRHTCCHRIKHDCAKAKNGLYSIRVSNPTSFTVEYRITKDPNQRGNNKFGILFGLLANEHINGCSAFGADNDLPRHGFFVDDLLNRVGGDTTGEPLEIRNTMPTLCISSANTFRFSLLTVPYLHLCGEIRQGDQDIQFPIQFKDLPMDDYRPVIAFTGIGEGVWGVDAKEVRTCFPWHSGWSVWEAGLVAYNYADVAFVLQGGEWYPAHKVVLAAQSETLNELFLEQGPAFVHVYVPRAVSMTAMESFLKYLYTNNFMSGHAYTNNLADVLFLAYYYEVEELFHTCGLEILNMLSNDTIFDALRMVHALGRWRGETRSSMAVDWLLTELRKYLQRDSGRLDAFLQDLLRLSA